MIYNLGETILLILITSCYDMGLMCEPIWPVWVKTDKEQDRQDTFLIWTDAFWSTVSFFPADALRCFSCHYDTSLNSTLCETTTENCTADLKFCLTQTEGRHDGSKVFTRGCAPSVVCETDYCDEQVIQLLGRKSCSITCCQENFCNRDDYIPPVGTGHVSHVHWLLTLACLIVATWLSLFGIDNWIRDDGGRDSERTNGVLRGLAGFRFERSTLEYRKHNLEKWK